MPRKIGAPDIRIGGDQTPTTRKIYSKKRLKTMFSYVLIETEFTSCGVFKKVFAVTDDQQTAYNWRSEELPRNVGREVVLAKVV